MTKGYLHIQRNASIDRPEAKTNEFLVFTFLTVDSLCWNRCLHDFTTMLSRSVAIKIVKVERLKEKIFNLTMHISTLNSRKVSLEVGKFCFPAMVLIAFKIAFFVIAKLILSHFSPWISLLPAESNILRHINLGCQRTTLVGMEWKVQRKMGGNLFRSSARTYQTVSARHEFWIKLCSFEISSVIFIFPCHTDQRSPRPTMGSSRKKTKFTNL